MTVLTPEPPEEQDPYAYEEEPPHRLSDGKRAVLIALVTIAVLTVVAIFIVAYEANTRDLGRPAPVNSEAL